MGTGRKAGEVAELPVRGRELRRLARGPACGAGEKGSRLGIEKERSDVGVESSTTAVLPAVPADAGAPEVAVDAEVWCRALWSC